MIMKKIHVKIKERSKQKSKTTIICIISIFAFSFLCLDIFLFVNIKEKNKTIESLTSEISQSKKYKSLYNEINSKYENTNDKNSRILDFYDDYIVIVPDNGSDCYHQYGCFDSITSTGNYKVYSLVEAKKSGLKPCPKCINSKN